MASVYTKLVRANLKFNGEGGLIAVDAHGNVTLPFNSEGMYKGWIDENGQPNSALYYE